MTPPVTRRSGVPRRPGRTWRTDYARSARRGLTQEALAERAGLRRSLLTSIEQGLYRPSQHVALALASALALPVQELLGAVTLEHLRQPTSVPEVFSRRLRERRMALRLTVRTLAGRAGLHHSYISHLERGVSHPSRAVVTALARALDLRVDALIGEGYQERSRPETGLPAVPRAQRETLELSQAVVARRAGISTSHVKAIEAGRSRPTQEVIAQLARALELSEEELLGDQDRAAFRARGQPAPGLGARLRLRRRTLGLTAETLATRVGVTATSLSQIERGAWLPSRVVGPGRGHGAGPALGGVGRRLYPHLLARGARGTDRVCPAPGPTAWGARADPGGPRGRGRPQGALYLRAGTGPEPAERRGGHSSGGGPGRAPGGSAGGCGPPVICTPGGRAMVGWALACARDARRWASHRTL